VKVFYLTQIFLLFLLLEIFKHVALFFLILHVAIFFIINLYMCVLCSSVRAIVALNLHNYGSGRNPWGSPKRQYLEKVSHICPPSLFFKPVNFALFSIHLHVITVNLWLRLRLVQG